MNEKQKAVQVAIASIEKQFGKGAIMQLGTVEEPRVSVIPTGSVGLDRALGSGGWARGRLSEMFGGDASTRASLALHAVAQVQALGGVASYIDLRHRLDLDFARRVGVRLPDLLVSQPETGEQALEICLHLVRSGAVDLIVFDCEEMLVRAELEPEESGQPVEGGAARFLINALKQLCAAVSRSGTSLLFLDEQKRGAVGSNALKFYSSVRVELSTVDKSPETFVRADVVKNKIAPPFRRAVIPLNALGIDREAEVVDLSVELNLMEKQGSHFSLGGERIGQGHERACEWLRERPQVTEELAQKILATKVVL